MANNLTNTAEALVLDWINGISPAPTRPTTPLKIALYTTTPNTETGSGGTEVSGYNYARTNVTFSAASGGSTANSADVTFPTASGGSWGTVQGIGIYDSAGTPVLLWVGALTTPKTIDDGDTFKILAGALTISLD